MSYRIPDGRIVYAVGDVHGMSHLLVTIRGLIRQHAATKPHLKPTIVWLGDYVDRGPDSAGAIRVLMGGMASDPTPDKDAEPWDEVFLRGNHEDFMLRALAGDGNALQMWLGNGGGATLSSYKDGIVDPEHRRWLAKTELYYECGDYVFVHGGVTANKPMAKQDPDMLLWKRWTKDDINPLLGKVVVYGHSVYPHPQEKPGRIGIDTGSFCYGRLTALALWDDQKWYIQARGPDMHGKVHMSALERMAA